MPGAAHRNRHRRHVHDFVAYDEVGASVRPRSCRRPGGTLTSVFEGVKTLSRSSRLGFTVHGTTVRLNAFFSAGENVCTCSQPPASATSITSPRRPSGHLQRPLFGSRLRSSHAGHRQIQAASTTPGPELSRSTKAIRVADRRVRDEASARMRSRSSSPRQPRTELRVAGFHRSLPDFGVSLSHRVAREWRNIERTSSAVIDAYIAPTVRRSSRLQRKRCSGPRARLPCHAVERRHRHRPSRPRSPAPDAAVRTRRRRDRRRALARILDRPNLIGIDMGGTSFDVSRSPRKARCRP